MRENAAVFVCALCGYELSWLELHRPHEGDWGTGGARPLDTESDQ